MAASLTGKCRIRHVKCDEEKPACLKCQSTGRVCDGYSNTKEARSSSAVAHQANQISSGGMVQISSSLSEPFAGTDAERRGFAYFRWETEKEIGSALNLDLAYRLMLQLGHSNSAVRSAVIALGSIAEGLQVNNVLCFSTGRAHGDHNFAQAQYFQAVRQLQQQITEDPYQSEIVAIISCLLLTLCDLLQGNNTASMVHLRSGLSILRQQNEPSSLERQELLRIFSAMDTQATLWMDLKTFQSPILNPLIPEGLPIQVDFFNNLEEAAISLNSLISNMYHFRRLITNETGEQNSPIALVQKRDLGMQLELWPLALETLLANHSTELSVEMLHRTFVMRINHIITKIAFGACLHEDEERVFRAHLADFRSIVSIARTVLRPMNADVLARVQRIVTLNNASINPVAVFSFCAGVIQPLYMTAIQCTDRKVCSEAIDLLSSLPWQEGALDSATMAMMAKRKIRQLEKRAFMAMALI